VEELCGKGLDLTLKSLEGLIKAWVRATGPLGVIGHGWVIARAADGGLG